jgi:DNA mismatch repair protein MutH
LERKEALKKIQQIIGHDLRILACQYEITVFKEGKKNKGWAGHVIERYLGLPMNSSRSPNFGSWELKTISLKRLSNGMFTIKETMAITMIDEYHVRRNDFEHSHLLTKLQKQVIVARIWNNQQESSSVLFGVKEFDLSDPVIYKQIKDDYDLVRNTIINNGYTALSGKMGVFIQPRTKGPGHGSTSRAFYARTSFLKNLLLFDTESATS